MRAGRVLEFALVFLLAVALIAGILQSTGGKLDDSASNLLIALIWPFSILSVTLIFRRRVGKFLSAIEIRIREGADFKLGPLEVGAKIGDIPSPSADENVTLTNIALLHTSFLSEEGTRSMNDGQVYYQFEIVVIAPDDVMSRVKQVTYKLPAAWRGANGVQVTCDRLSRFKMKQLANGTAVVLAEVEIEGQDKPVILNRFIDLHRKGPRI